jgi:hypothetical protein
MKSKSAVLVLLATAAGATMLMSAPAEAGRKTGTWKYSPQAIYQYQRSQEYNGWRNRRGPPYGHAYGYRSGPRYERWDDDY